MCGILYLDRKDGKLCVKQALKRYHKQRARGSEGFGYVAMKDGKVQSFDRFQFEHDMEKKLSAADATSVLFHHRYPTSVLNLAETAHPIEVRHKELENVYYIVHNGHITNDETLRAEHMTLGYRYTTDVVTEYSTAKGKNYFGDTEWNDSEALAIEIARSIEGKTDLVRAEGAIAYIALQVRRGKPIALYFGTNGGNPLTINEDPNFFAIASQGGKAIVDNQGYRRDLMRTGEVKICDAVKLIPAYVAPKTYGTGFVKRSYTERTYRHRDEDTDGTLPLQKHHGSEAYHAMSMDEMEDELDVCDQNIIDATIAIREAQDAGDYEGEAAWYAEKATLTNKRNKLQNLYAEKSNALA